MAFKFFLSNDVFVCIFIVIKQEKFIRLHVSLNKKYINLDDIN